MFPSEDKEVYFDRYCPKCEYGNLPGKQDPCNECLDNPINLYSHKPINFKEKNYENKRSYTIHNKKG
jgi:hypothetical protein